jgi:hypothetical protein
LGALDLHALPDGRIIVYHRASNTEKRFALEEFKRIVTWLLEYYREGITDLSPIVKTFPANEQEFEEAPKDCDIKAVLALWRYRFELYRFVKTNNLFRITFPNHWEGVIKTIRAKLDWLRTQGGWDQKATLGWEIDALYDKILAAKTKKQLLPLCKELILKYKDMIALIKKIVCPVIKSYFVKQGIYPDYMKCMYCPFRVFHFRFDRIEIRDNLFEADLASLDFRTLKAKAEAFIAIVKPVTKLHQLLKASNYPSWNEIKQAIPEMIEYEKDSYLERLLGGGSGQ